MNVPLSLVSLQRADWQTSARGGSSSKDLPCVSSHASSSPLAQAADARISSSLGPEEGGTSDPDSMAEGERPM